jgi:hypothetical protein
MRLLPAALLFAFGVGPALAQRAPVVVMPSRPDVPVLMNGADVSYAVIEGEFGLDRPGSSKTVVYRPFVIPFPVYYAPFLRPSERSYFPTTGRRPGYGRLEINPPPDRVLPPPAPTYYRHWSSESDTGPATQYTPAYGGPVAPVHGRYGRQEHQQSQEPAGVFRTEPDGRF